MRIIARTLAFCVLATGAVLVQAQVVQEVDSERITASDSVSREADPALKAVADLVVAQTNELRRAQKLDPVKPAPKLVEAARYFAEYMAEKDVYGHNADGQAPADRAKKFGYEYCIVSENIAYQYQHGRIDNKELATRFFTRWKNSELHRKNMLDPDMTDTGVAVAQSAKSGYYYAVQMFGRPKSATIRFEIVNEARELIEYRIGEAKFELPPRYRRVHEQCRPPEVTLVSTQEGKERTTTIKPRSGETLRVSIDPASGLIVRRG